MATSSPLVSFQCKIKLTAGHYARVKREGGRATLHRAIDENKDQTYYLSQVTEASLSRVSSHLSGTGSHSGRIPASCNSETQGTRACTPVRPSNRGEEGEHGRLLYWRAGQVQ